MTSRDFDLLSSWQFELPVELIASRPAARRDDSRLLVIDRASGRIVHSWIRELPQWLTSGDLLVFNNTRVLPARLFGVRVLTGGRWEGLYIEQRETGEWHLLCETRGKLTAGERIRVLPVKSRALPGAAPDPGESGLILQLTEKQSDGSWLATVDDKRGVREILEQVQLVGQLTQLEQELVQLVTVQQGGLIRLEEDLVQQELTGLPEVHQLTGQILTQQVEQLEVLIPVQLEERQERLKLNVVLMFPIVT